MKYVLLCVAALAICICLAIITVRLTDRRKTRNRFAKTLLVMVLSMVYLMAMGIVYLEIYYHADDQAKACLESTDKVTVSRAGNAYLFDGPGEGRAVIFYPGAKVESSAYAPLMASVAESGVDAFLVEMPFRFAFFGIDSADELIDEYDYESWYMMGHSMGGLAACAFAGDEEDDVDGVIYLASYPSAGPFQGIKMLSIYGTEDGCLNREEYKNSRPYWPDDAEECVIEGGNHAQFGNYGEQKGDGTAKISAEEQQKQTAEAIKKWLD